jgi:hypothetical protein
MGETHTRTLEKHQRKFGGRFENLSNRPSEELLNERGINSLFHSFQIKNDQIHFLGAQLFFVNLEELFHVHFVHSVFKEKRVQFLNLLIILVFVEQPETNVNYENHDRLEKIK